MKILESLEKYILYITVAVFPVFILLMSSSPAILSKYELVAVAIALFLLVRVIRMALGGKVSLAVGKFDLGVLLLVISYSLSAIFKTPNKMEAFFIPGIATAVILSALFYFLVNQLDKKGKEGIKIAFIVSGVVLSLCLTLSGFGLLSKIPQLPTLVKDPLFNPMGGVIPAGIYLIPVLLICISTVLKEKDVAGKAFWGASAAVIVMTLVILVNTALPGKAQSPRLPSLQTSWEVAIGALAKSPLLGVGPANYLSAFNQFRPVSYNATDLWSVRFTTSSDFYLTAITETGLVGLASLLLLFSLLYKSYMSYKTNRTYVGEGLALVALLLLFAVFPASPILFVPLFTLLALFSRSEEHYLAESGSKVPYLILGVLVLTGVGVAGFFGAKAVLAEATYTKSLYALSANDAKNTYALMQLAVKENPKVDRYHGSLAQVDMAIASSVANKKDLTDADKQTVTTLVQQAINEGKASVLLNPQRSGNWEALAQVYRSIMPFAQGADQFAVQTYTQAVALDPTSPNLRIALGGVYYALGRFDDAIDAFKLAVIAKPDLPNAHYNLALAYREKKDFDNAIAQMKAVLSLVKKDSQDYKLAQSTLEDLQKNKPAAKTAGSENLTSPKPLGTSNIKPPIQLPSEATPPASQ